MSQREGVILSAAKNLARADERFFKTSTGGRLQRMTGEASAFQKPYPCQAGLAPALVRSHNELLFHPSGLSVAIRYHK
jgi:hypothetical protein